MDPDRLDLDTPILLPVPVPFNLRTETDAGGRERFGNRGVGWHSESKGLEVPTTLTSSNRGPSSLRRSP